MSAIPQLPHAWRLRAPLAPALRRGLLVSIPVGVAILVDLELDSPAAGAVATGALMTGFIAFDAPALVRLRWQLAAAPAIGLAAALGALTADPAWLAVATMTAFASAAGLAVAVTPRFGIAGLICVLSLLLAQGLALEPGDAPAALALGAAGAGLQALVSLISGLLGRRREDPSPQPGAPEAANRIRLAVSVRSESFWHALRWGSALGVGTAVSHLVDLGPHSYWIPLTVLFVLKPSPDETIERMGMRAVGTVAGLLAATALAALLGRHAIPLAAVISFAAAFCFALLAIEYALFTAAVTVFVVLLIYALGASASEAVDERAIGTAIGIGIVALAVLTWGGRSAPREPGAGPGAGSAP